MTGSEKNLRPSVKDRLPWITLELFENWKFDPDASNEELIVALDLTDILLTDSSLLTDVGVTKVKPFSIELRKIARERGIYLEGDSEENPTEDQDSPPVKPYSVFDDPHINI